LEALVKRMIIAAALGLGVQAATATPAAASGYVYTGQWFTTKAACDRAWQNEHGGPGVPTTPHQCRYNPVGVYELWAYEV
jgi:hypothetical protein